MKIELPGVERVEPLATTRGEAKRRLIQFWSKCQRRCRGQRFRKESSLLASCHSTPEKIGDDEEETKNETVLPPKAFARGLPRRKRISRYVAFCVCGPFLLGLCPLATGCVLIYFFSPIGYSSINSNGYWGPDTSSIPVQLICSMGPLFSSIEAFFDIDILVVNGLCYSSAKSLDLAWDVGVGHSIQLFMGWISYKAYMHGLMRITESRPVSYTLFSSLTLRGNSICSARHLLPSFFKASTARERFILGWMLYAILYTVGIQSFLSAAAGYTTPQSTSILLADGSTAKPYYFACSQLIKFSGLSSYGIADGTLIRPYCDVPDMPEPEDESFIDLVSYYGISS